MSNIASTFKRLAENNVRYDRLCLIYVYLLQNNSLMKKVLFRESHHNHNPV